MTSKLIVNELSADTGISTITVGDNMSGVTFKTGTSNLHNVGIEIAGINVLGADTPIGAGATIYNSGAALFTGTVTAPSLDISGDIDVDGHTELDNGNVSGVVTFTNSPNAIQMNDDARVSFGTSLKTSISYNTSDSRTKIRNYNDTLEIGYRSTELHYINQARLTIAGANTFSADANTTFTGANYSASWIPSTNTFRVNDNAKLALGTNSDTTLYHNNSHFYLQNTTGNINVTGNVVLNNDISVDGHTNLDNVSIAGITTFSDRAYLAHDLTITGTAPRVIFTDTNNNSDYRINVDAGNFEVQDVTNSYATRFRIKSDGNIGINDTDPSYKLNVIGDNAAYNGIGMLKGIIGVQNDTTAFGSSPTAGISFQTKYRTGPDVPLDVAAIWGGKENTTNGDKDGYMGFATREEGGSGSQERMRITSSGQLAIGGTTNVGTLLHIENGSGDAYIRCRASINKALLFNNSDGTAHGFLGSGGTNGGAGADLAIQSNSGNVMFYANNGLRAKVTSDGFVSENGTSGDGDDNIGIALENDYSAWGIIFRNDWINQNNGWGTFWAGNSGAAYRRETNDGNPNEYVFVGSGQKRFTFELNDGTYFSDGAVHGSHYDYAEYFEWEDGNPSNEDRRGYSVFVNSNGKIEKATDSTNTSDVIGAITGTAHIIGDGAVYDWQGKWKVDEWGTVMRETVKQVTWKDEDGKNHSYDEDKVPSGLTIPSDASYRQHTRRILNPDYDESKEYVPRDMRQEWDPVGLLGKVRVRDDSPKNPNWKYIKTINGKKLWLIR